jgi:hypothetical protein
LYVPALPGTWQSVLQGKVVTVAPVTCTVTPSTDTPDVAAVTRMSMATGSAQGRAKQSWLQEANAMLEAQRTTSPAAVNLGLRPSWEGFFRAAAP